MSISAKFFTLINALLTYSSGFLEASVLTFFLRGPEYLHKGESEYLHKGEVEDLQGEANWLLKKTRDESTLPRNLLLTVATLFHQKSDIVLQPN